MSTRSDTDAGGKGGAPATSTTTTTYSYFANFAVGLCEGPDRPRRAHLGRRQAARSHRHHVPRLYRQRRRRTPDPLIVAKEGADNAPAYRGLAYVVFERLPLENFGNRIPQLSFEVMRPVGRLETMVRAVTLIPGTTEFGYEPSTVRAGARAGAVRAPRTATSAHAVVRRRGGARRSAGACPNLERVALVVAWFGNDLRAGHCTVTPGVEIADQDDLSGDLVGRGPRPRRRASSCRRSTGGRPSAARRRTTASRT